MSDSTYILDNKLLASNDSRFINNLVDSSLTYAFSLVLQYFFFPFLIGFFDSFDLTGFGVWYYNLNEWYWLGISWTLTLGYYVLTEGFLGRSLGKFITGTIVINKSGNKPGFRIILIRTLIRFIPLDILSFLGNSGRGWHDSFSNTYVVKKKALDESIKLHYEFDLIGMPEIE
ncbi:RDD family protein [Flavobacterium sp. LM4]|uniref:RDD family protein n=1 Tax=Flavobacterium sp. LM4 TaxID=1938609 RepID=UPI0009941881|nr:RDD family protein [Flavobacterium sp. LM4]OOV19862.1 transporter [Flavobacterium sp. LM4]